MQRQVLAICSWSITKLLKLGLDLKALELARLWKLSDLACQVWVGCRIRNWQDSILAKLWQHLGKLLHELVSGSALQTCFWLLLSLNSFRICLPHRLLSVLLICLALIVGFFAPILLNCFRLRIQLFKTRLTRFNINGIALTRSVFPTCTLRR